MNLEQQNKVFDTLDVLRRECYGDLQADEASKILIRISSLYGTIIEISIDAQMDYNRYFQRMTEEFEKVTEARAQAKASPEYEQVLRLKGRVDVCKELINSLKYLLKVKLDEKRESIY